MVQWSKTRPRVQILEHPENKSGYGGYKDNSVDKGTLPADQGSIPTTHMASYNQPSVTAVPGARHPLLSPDMHVVQICRQNTHAHKFL